MHETQNPISNERLLRLTHVLKIIPVSRSTWWKGVQEGKFPAPLKLGPRTTCWRKSDIEALIEGIANQRA